MNSGAQEARGSFSIKTWYCDMVASHGQVCFLVMEATTQGLTFDELYRRYVIAATGSYRRPYAKKMYVDKIKIKWSNVVPTNEYLRELIEDGWIIVL